MQAVTVSITDGEAYQYSTLVDTIFLIIPQCLYDINNLMLGYYAKYYAQCLGRM